VPQAAPVASETGPKTQATTSTPASAPVPNESSPPQPAAAPKNAPRQAPAGQGATGYQGPTLTERINDKLTLADLVAEFGLQVKPTAGGKELVTKCFMSGHEEKTASMFINPSKGVFHCWGCGATGNVIAMFAELENMSYDDAKMSLGKRLGVITERQQDPDVKMLTQVAQRYRAALDRAKQASEYLESRGITRETIDKFQIGFCWGDEFSKAGPDALAIATRAGIMRPKDPEHPDRPPRAYMHGRIVFPIKNRYGQVISFGGRIMPRLEGGDHGPKYLNGPETEFFKKSETLYGLFEAKQGIHKSGFAVAVEGYMDTAMLHQVGADNAFAVMGAATSEKAFEQLWKLTDRVVYCLDGDKAGLAGTVRSIKTAAPTMSDGDTIDIMLLPAGVDPDEYVLEHGLEGWHKLVEAAQPFSVFMEATIRKDFDLQSPESRAAYRKAMEDLADEFSGAPRLKEQIVSYATAVVNAFTIETALAGKNIRATDTEIIDALLAVRSRQIAAPKKEAPRPPTQTI
jgi:DNA primase